MKIAYRTIGLLLIAICMTCTTEYPVDVPVIPPLPALNAVPDISKPLMEGVYTIPSSGRFGDDAVVKWSTKYVSIFTRTAYMILETGTKDSVIYMRGYWRVPTSDDMGLVDLVIAKDEGAASLLKGIIPASLILKGKYGQQNNPATINISFVFSRTFSATVTSKKFLIVGHRGGGRTSDRLPISENSNAMIGYAERFGANGVEIDVRLTKDKVPVLYHDDDINIRLTQKGPLNGPISNFTYIQLLTFVELIRGEEIPTLRSALKFAIDNTQLQFVWLDTKDPEVVSYTIPIQREMLQYASSKGRTIDILIGVPADDVLAAVKSMPDYTNIPTLCEISTEEAIALHSKAWGPRWTLGTQNDLVASVQAQGIMALCWTIDMPAYINQFINEGRFDGLLTNYPSYVAYYHYIRE